jgi:hypothetical protein
LAPLPRGGPPAGRARANASHPPEEALEGLTRTLSAGGISPWSVK